MKFGKVDNPELINFEFPQIPKETFELLAVNGSKAKNGVQPIQVSVGCAKWNKTDLKGFYPKATKDELTYYSRQFNSIELNATFYKSPSPDQVITWKNKTPKDFLFFPKIPQTISHFSRLIDTSNQVENFIQATNLFGPQLGCAFLQMHENFKPKDFKSLELFLWSIPSNYPLAVEVRNAEWFANSEISEDYFQLLESRNIPSIWVDTAGRRDMLHLRLTSTKAFVRFVGANHPTDFNRLDEWVELIFNLKNKGLENLYFFIHQHHELESPFLAKYFIEKLNLRIGTSLKTPLIASLMDKNQGNTLF